jgi:hypothetical protein
VPRLVQAIPSKHPICRVCHRPHAPGGKHPTDPSDWADPATEEEADERAWELFFREFGHSRAPQEVELMKRELLKIHRKFPGLSGAEGVKRLGDVMRSRGLRGS